MQPTRGLSVLLLGMWLFMQGSLRLLGISFPASGVVLEVLAIAAGVPISVGREGRGGGRFPTGGLSGRPSVFPTEHERAYASTTRKIPHNETRWE